MVSIIDSIIKVCDSIWFCIFVFISKYFKGEIDNVIFLFSNGQCFQIEIINSFQRLYCFFEE